MLRRKIKDGVHSRINNNSSNNIDENQNIIENLTKVLEDPQLSQEELPGDKSTILNKQKSKKKKTKANTKFGQVKIRHARRGISSCFQALMGFFILGGLITSAYQSYGSAPEAVGGLAILTTVFCSLGFMNALHGFRERDKNYITCKLGILLNGAIIFIFFLLYMRGIA